MQLHNLLAKMGAVSQIYGNVTQKMIAVTDQMKEIFVLKKHALTFSSLVHARVTVYRNHGFVTVMTTVSINK